MSVDWDEFEERGRERREGRRDYPPKHDWVSVAIGAVIFAFIILVVVWSYV